MKGNADYVIGLLVSVGFAVVFVSNMISLYRDYKIRKKLKEEAKKKQEPKVIKGYIINGKEHRSEDRRKKKL